MASYNLTLNLGSGDEGKRRDEAYRKAADYENETLNAWVKKHLDAAANVIEDEKKNTR